MNSHLMYEGVTPNINSVSEKLTSFGKNYFNVQEPESEFLIHGDGIQNWKSQIKTFLQKLFLKNVFK